ncbi:sialin-like isoform X1 [Scylla paramamosain]|uniref:sialin-like isoform X1 n=2 Tax=Scylla paramamosain TaxID=85552 RepID=UPI00308375DC
MTTGIVLGADMEKSAMQTSALSPSHKPNNTSNTGMPWWDARKTLVLLSFLGLTVAYMVRVCLSITIVAIVKRNVTIDISDNDTCPVPDDAIKDTEAGGDYEWDGQTQTILLGAFFYGYTVSNFPGGRVAEYFGPRLTVGLGILLPSVLTLLSPLCIYTSPVLFIVLRVLEGLTQGVTFPAMHFMMSAWIPPKDKAKYWSLQGSGMQIGTVVAMSVGGWLCSTTFLGGWPSVFYVFGGLGVIWAIPWFLLIHDLPEHHPRISDAELQYILEHRRYVKREKVVAIPWRHIATSQPFWAIMASSFCYNFSFYTLLTELPTYFNKILHFDMSTNGLSSALPYIVQCLAAVSWGMFVDILQKRNVLSVKTVRKLSTSLALYSSAACLIGMMWVNCDPTVAMVVMCLAVGLIGPIGSGSPLSEQDIAPNLAGTLKGLTNTLGSATGFVAPAVTGAITSGNQTVSAWNTVFVISAVFNLIFGTIYVIFGTDKVQPWNDSKPKKVRFPVCYVGVVVDGHCSSLLASFQRHEVDGASKQAQEGHHMEHFYSAVQLKNNIFCYVRSRFDCMHSTNQPHSSMTFSNLLICCTLSIHQMPTLQTL